MYIAFFSHSLLWHVLYTRSESKEINGYLVNIYMYLDKKASMIYIVSGGSETPVTK